MNDETTLTCNPDPLHMDWNEEKVERLYRTRITEDLKRLPHDGDDLHRLFKAFSSMSLLIEWARESTASSPVYHEAGRLNRTLRQLVTSVWQEPRIPPRMAAEEVVLIDDRVGPPGHFMTMPKGYIAKGLAQHYLQWSEKARDAFFDRLERINEPRDASWYSPPPAQRTVLEHVHPAEILSANLIDLINGGCSHRHWVDFFLDAHIIGLGRQSFVMLTQEESGMLVDAGLQPSAVLTLDDPRPLGRYRRAGIEGAFMKLADDPRYFSQRQRQSRR